MRSLAFLEIVVMVLVIFCFPCSFAGEKNAPEKPDLDALCNKVFSITYPDGRNITDCILREPTEIQGRWCAKGDTLFDKDWNLVACKLKQDYTVGNATVPARSWVQFSLERPGYLEETGADYATLYVMEDSTYTVIKKNIHLYDNGELMAKIKRRQYAVVMLDPGEHLISLAMKTNGILIDAAAGETYYMVYTDKNWYVNRGLRLRRVGRQKALSLLSDMKEVVPVGERRSPPRAVTPQISAPNPTGSKVLQVAVGASHSCMLSENGKVACWGDNSTAQIGDTDSEIVLEPRWVEQLEEVESISAGAGFTCALNGEGQVRCWGIGSEGQLGNGAEPESSAVAEVVELSNAVEISAGWAHACARLEDGRVACWGNNEEGQLGDGTWESSSSPKPVPQLKDVVSISCGVAHSCAATEPGKVYCWGTDGFGSGMSTFESETPVEIEGVSQASRVTCGRNHTCALFGDGTVRCWGSNIMKQSGSKSREPLVEKPTAVKDADGASDLAAGLFHTCALSEDQVLCWGANMAGSLGRPTRSDSSWKAQPVEGLGAAVTKVSSGGVTSCAIDDSGSVLCWGNNETGQLGRDVDRVLYSVTPVRMAMPGAE
jgi:alpha-tubulin suppressor-like RCC1 family protein